ncbi:amino acid adenylation domain-containing protein, partial [Pseudomonas sp. ES1]
ARNPQGGQQNRHAVTVNARLDQEATRRLLQDAPAAYRTQVNDLLLTALARVVCRWSQHADTLIQLEGHGREALDDSLDLSRSVGWFTSLYPVRLTPAEGLRESIRGIKEQLRAIPAKGIGYGALRYLGDDAARASLAGLAQPRITFNYLGQFDASFDEGEALFSPADESAGQEQDLDAPLANWLTLNGQVYGGELSVNWTFSGECFDEGEIQALADAYSAELVLLADHCRGLAEASATPSDFPLCQLDQATLDSLPLPLAQVEDIYPLSPTQMGMLFHSLEADGAALYINQSSVEVRGLDAMRFIAAWNSVIARHEILRTGFWTASTLREPLQVVLRQAALPAQVLDWRERQVSEADLRALASAECEQGFDLLRAPLTRLTMVRLDDQRHQLIWTSHHILMDGWSNSRLLGEVFQAYAGQALPGKRGRYRDYIEWLQQQSLPAQQAFWQDKLRTLEGSTALASSLPAPQAPQPGHQALYLDWSASRTAQLREQAQRLRVTPNTLIQAAWVLLLQRYTGQDTVCFGATVAGRPASLAGADEMLGLFINTLPIVQAPQPQQTLASWLGELQGYNLEVREHEHSALADIQRWSGQGGQSLFDSIVVFENYPVDERLKEAGSDELQFGEVAGRDVTNYAMDLAVMLGQTLRIEFLYRTDRFSEQACAKVLGSFESLLQGMLDAPDSSLGSLGMLDAAQQQMLWAENLLPAGEAAATPLVQRIVAHGLARPDAEAVVCGAERLTYAQLESRANRLAQHLCGLGIGPESLVGIALERSVEVIVAFYAVMKTGAAYVPLDIDYPRERLEWIVDDSQMTVLITQSGLSERMAASAPLIELDTLDLSGQPDTAPAPRALAEHLAYLIYTSGSTGLPKGVAVAQGAIALHCQAIGGLYQMDAHTRELLFMSFAFDGAQERWLTTLSHGGCLVLRDNRLWTPEETWQALHQQRIDVACFPPAYLQQLAEYCEGREAPPVRVYCFGGDAVAEANFELVKRTLKPRTLTNGYGPTETVVTPLLWKADASQQCEAVYAPIGRRVGARTLYVLDNQLNPVPDGVAGELYIGGACLARGYHRRPGLSAERFVADPFGQGGRLYRSGDLVRRRADGVVDYLGRLDHQVKVRGFRIELGEIESRLRRAVEVRDAVVVARDSQAGKQLIGYVAASADAGLGERLRGVLGQELPDYMVPLQIVVLDQLPLNPNGKVDRKALPDPDFTSASHVAPRNALEQALAQIWQEVLQLERVGVTDNFFEIGGDSLTTLKVLGKVRSADLGIELKLRDMMTRPTIAELSGYSEVADAELDPLLALNSEVAAAAPLFCLHAGFGTVFDYEPLARRLDGERRVYGMQCRMLLDRDWQDTSLQAMAIDYSQYIRQKQADGPYHLLGWSLGAPLALLVAEELERQGQTVAFLGLVDSFVPGADAGADDSLDADLRAFLEVVFGTPRDDLRLPVLEDVEQLAPLQAVIAALQGKGLNGSAYAGFAADELAHTFRVAMRLKGLSQQLDSLPATRAQGLCWWAAGQSAEVRGDFVRAIGAREVDGQVAASHFQMLGSQTCLDSLVAELRRLVLARA